MAITWDTDVDPGEISPNNIITSLLALVPASPTPPSFTRIPSLAPTMKLGAGVGIWDQTEGKVFPKVGRRNTHPPKFEDFFQNSSKRLRFTFFERRNGSVGKCLYRSRAGKECVGTQTG